MRPSVPILLAALTVASCSPEAIEDGATAVRPTTNREAIHGEDGRTLAVLAGKTLYLSGVQPADVSVPIAGQTASAMERLGQTLGLRGLDYSHVVSCHVHLADMDHYADMNSVYGSFFDEGGYPARTTLEVPGLPDGAGILLMCIAYSDPSEIEVVRPPATEIPSAMGPYSPAVRAGRTIYLSGQGGRNPTSGELAESTADQAKQTLRTIGAILGAAGLTFDNTALASSYFPPSSDPEAIDGAYEDIFDPGGAPSRANVPLSRLPGDIAVEITFVAVDDNYVTRLFMHDQAPTAISSPASLTGGVVYTSAFPGRGETFREQVLHALQTQESALELALMDLSKIVRVTAYLSSMDDLEQLRTVLSEALSGLTPALTAIQARNPANSAVSLEVIAVQ